MDLFKFQHSCWVIRSLEDNHYSLEAVTEGNSNLTTTEQPVSARESLMYAIATDVH